MGSSSSVNKESKHVYISYSLSLHTNLQHIQELRDKLKQKGYSVTTSDFTNKVFDKMSDVKNVVKTMDNIVSNSTLIIICVSKQTLSNYYQTIEMKSAFASKKKVVFLMTDETYTPETHPLFTNSYKYDWFPFYYKLNVKTVLKFLKI